MWNWLYGPPIEEGPGYYMVTRSLTLDVDAVRDVYRIVDGNAGPAVLKVMPPIGLEGPGRFGRESAIDDISRMPTSELQRLVISNSDTGSQHLHVDFRGGSQPVISYDPTTDRAARDIAHFLLAEGSPRIKWSVLRVLPAMAASVAVVLAGAALLVRHTFGSWPQDILALGLVLVVAALTRDLVQRSFDARMPTARLYRGHRISATTRADRRARWANLRVQVPTALAGAVGGSILTLLTAWLTR